MTKAVCAVAVGIAAVAVTGIGPALAIGAVAVLVPALIARLAARLIRTTILLVLPIAISAVVVNLFLLPSSGDVLFRLGPLTATAGGLQFGLAVTARLVTIAGAASLFYLTTTPGDLSIDLERRGVPPRLVFVIGASVRTVPAMADLAADVVAAQRARGLDTEGSVLARVRGIVPLVGPVVVGSIAEVETRTMALEARGFGRAGPRTLLWAPADSGRQRLARWSVLFAVGALVVARFAGWAS